MATLDAILAELKSKGSEKTRKTYARHGIPIDRTFGVSNADLKLIAKSIRNQQNLAYELFATGNVDAMYLAGLVATGSQMSKDQLHAWAKAAAGITMISEHTVPWLAVESPFATELAEEWIESIEEQVASAGWCVYSGLVATVPDDVLDLGKIEGLLDRVAREIHHAKNRVRYTMNGFVISVGCYVAPLSEHVDAVARQIGAVSVDVGDTACKVPLATEYIRKVKDAGRLGQKRKTIRC